MTYVLVMYIYAGMLAKGDSVALQVINEFSSADSCKSAGVKGNELVGGSAKNYRFVCLPKK